MIGLITDVVIRTFLADVNRSASVSTSASVGRLYQSVSACAVFDQCDQSRQTEAQSETQLQLELSGVER